LLSCKDTRVSSTEGITEECVQLRHIREVMKRIAVPYLHSNFKF